MYMVFNQRILSICFAIFSFLSFGLGMCSVPFSLVHVGVCFSLGAGLWDQMLCDPVAWSRRQGQVVDPL